MRSICALLLFALACSYAVAQRLESLTPELRKYLRTGTSRVVLEHVNLIDGTGAAPLPDRNITLEDGRITSISAGADGQQTDGTTLLNLRGYSVIPGLVGMHEHLYAGMFHQMTYSAPPLYLANGVTTARTTGSVEPYTDLRLRDAIEKGEFPGPHLDVTGPYLEGATTRHHIFQMHLLSGPDDARQTVAYWADRGVTSFKAYADITRDELKAAIGEAHKHGTKVTGHLCSVTYPEAIEAGIDDLEHGFRADTELDPGKKPDLCSDSGGDATLEQLVPGSAAANRLIGLLVQHHVAITSTLVNAASALPDAPLLRPAVLDAMAPSLRDELLYSKNRARSPGNAAALQRRDMDLQRAFVAAGGLLIAGSDSTGRNGNVPGFGEQREVESLVDAGFTPVEAIKIATLNGAIYLGRQEQIGSIAVGKNADLVVVNGDPATHITDIENVEIVFKDGVGYDTKKLLESVKGRYGEQ